MLVSVFLFACAQQGKKPVNGLVGEEAESVNDTTPELVVKKLTPLKEHKVYFKGTKNRMDVFRVKGVQPGKTMLIIGGIHGNEPGGYLSADKYVDIDLAVGNLIVVPRANLETIRANHRGIHGDMNRKFPTPGARDRNAKSIEVLKSLIAESDVVLNLHDGSGFYNPKWIDSTRNPNRFGQCLVVDREYWKSSTGKKIELQKPAENVVKRVNAKITNSKHKFHVNNTKTGLQKTFHPGMKFTATYHALLHSDVPAFGVETSKSLKTNRMKVLYQTMIINEFMTEYGIHSTLPLPQFDTPKVEYVLLKVNNEMPVAVSPGETLKIKPNSNINFVDLKGASERGYFLKDSNGRHIELGEEFRINKSQKVFIRKDAYKVASIRVELVKPESNSENSTAPIASDLTDLKAHILVKRNGKKTLVQFGETLKVLEGDKIEFAELTGVSKSRSKSMKVNVEGFIGNIKSNDGEDRGYVINTDKDFIKKWARPGPEHSSIYRVLLTENDQEISHIRLEVHEAAVANAVIESSDGVKQVVNFSDAQKKPIIVKGSGFKLLTPLVSEADPSLLKISYADKPLKGTSSGWEASFGKGNSSSLKVYYGDKLLGDVKVQGMASQVGK
jgi:hypothetical protein